MAKKKSTTKSKLGAVERANKAAANPRPVEVAQSAFAKWRTKPNADDGYLFVILPDTPGRNLAEKIEKVMADRKSEIALCKGRMAAADYFTAQMKFEIQKREPAWPGLKMIACRSTPDLIAKFNKGYFTIAPNCNVKNTKAVSARMQPGAKEKAGNYLNGLLENEDKRMTETVNGKLSRVSTNFMTLPVQKRKEFLTQITPEKMICIIPVGAKKEHVQVPPPKLGVPFG